MTRDFLDSLSIDDLPTPELRWLALRAGVRVAADYWRTWRGKIDSCPSRIPRELLRKYMLSRYAASTTDIAHSVGLSPRTVRRHKSMRACLVN